MFLSTKNNIATKSIFAGETINVNVSERTLPQIKVVNPDGNEEIINIDEQIKKIILFLMIKHSLTGNYKFNSGDKLLSTATYKYRSFRIRHQIFNPK